MLRIKNRLWWQVLRERFADALINANVESVAVDLGITETHDLAVSDFIDCKPWPPSYIEQYERAREGIDGMQVIQSVLISKGDEFVIHGSDFSHLKEIAEMLHKERETSYEVEEEADDIFRIKASKSRSLAIGYRAFKPSLMPQLAVASPTPGPSLATPTLEATPTRTPTPGPSIVANSKEYGLAWFDHFSNKLYKVNYTDFSNSDLTGAGNANDVLRRWCSPLDLSKRKIECQTVFQGPGRQWYRAKLHFMNDL